ncbi:Tricarboxylate/iron carrier [Baffinella frigidus]|nr:Tricarboxylate/iron carrier [Cryptophyta sp. CCMP2293]|mmetsp:Transcript_28784/g.68654  ORF Transcript_28784/g.68654 Transcript_28784/m.68654 type:complete len:323 (+) Transcript_28784:135-1103(+)
MSLPKYESDATRYDMKTWAGRTQHFIAVTNPTYLFASTANIQGAKDLLERARTGKTEAGTTDKELWAARTLTDAVLHPDTKEIMPAPFRVCAFVPANIPICMGMLMTPPTMANVLFWQWMNQSYNAGFNYSNRNASSSMTTEMLAGIYCTATTISCGIALGLGKLVKRLPVGPGTASLLAKVVPFAAVGSSNVFNLVAMRSGELTAGIPVADKDGRQLGISKAAAASAVKQSAITRIILPAPVLLLPPIMMRSVSKLGLPPRAKAAAELTVIVGCVWGALPPAIGFFPQETSLAISDLEPEFQGMKDAAGNPVGEVFFNRGL